MARDAAKLAGELEKLCMCGGCPANWIEKNRPALLSALRTAAAGEAAWAECDHIRNVEAMMLEGQSDPVTMAYADAVAEIPKVRARTDAARKEAGCGE